MGLIELTEQNELELAEGIRARIVTADSMTVAHVALDAGAVLPEHEHVHDRTCLVGCQRLDRRGAAVHR